MALESDAEDDDGAGRDDDGGSRDGDDFGAVDTPPSDEDEPPLGPQFEASFLDAVGGFDRVASRTISDDYLKTMAEEGWTEPVTHSPYDYLQEPYEARPVNWARHDYPGLYNGKYGPHQKRSRLQQRCPGPSSSSSSRSYGKT